PPPAVPTLNPRAPDTALGLDYFGQVFLVKVPAAGGGPLPPAQDVFGRGDQVGLFLESFAQGLRLPFSLRVFNRDTGILLGEARFGPPPTPGAAPPPPPPVVFFERFVWYRSGAELPGNYRLELYADAALTATL